VSSEADRWIWAKVTKVAPSYGPLKCSTLRSIELPAEGLGDAFREGTKVRDEPSESLETVLRIARVPEVNSSTGSKAK
jgi:hypothetical protein